MQDSSDDTIVRELLVAGTRLLARGQSAEAAALLEQARDRAPDDFDVALNLSAAYILTKKFRRAVPILEALSARDPRNVNVWTNLGAAYLGNPVLADDERQMRAVAAFEQALAINPIAPNVAYNIALIYKDRRDYDTAIGWFERALQANPTDRDARSWIERLRSRPDAAP